MTQEQMRRIWVKLAITVEVLILPAASALGVLTTCRNNERGNPSLSPQHTSLVWRVRWLRERRQVRNDCLVVCCHVVGYSRSNVPRDICTRTLQVPRVSLPHQ